MLRLVEGTLGLLEQSACPALGENRWLLLLILHLLAKSAARFLQVIIGFVCGLGRLDSFVLLH